MIKVIYVESDTDKAYGLISGILSAVATGWSSLDEGDKLTAYQKCDEGSVPAGLLKALGSFKAYVYSTGDNVVGISRPTANGSGVWTQTQKDGGDTYIPHCRIKALPTAQIVMPNKLLPLYGASAIMSVSVAGVVSTDSNITIAVTTDLKKYRTYNFDAAEWQDIDATSPLAMVSSGIPMAEISKIPSAGWKKLGTSGLAFAYCIKQKTIDNSLAFVENTSLVLSLIGRWDKAINGIDYRYGYISGDGLYINATFLRPGSYKINYTNADTARNVESRQEIFGMAIDESNVNDNGILVDSKGDTLL